MQGVLSLDPLEDELLGERSAVAANAVIDIEDQLCKDRG